MNSITIDNDEIKRIFNELSDLIIKQEKMLKKLSTMNWYFCIGM